MLSHFCQKAAFAAVTLLAGSGWAYQPKMFSSHSEVGVIKQDTAAALRADIARESSGRSWDLGPFKKDQKPYHGNM